MCKSSWRELDSKNVYRFPARSINRLEPSVCCGSHSDLLSIEWRAGLYAENVIAALLLFSVHASSDMDGGVKHGVSVVKLRMVV